MATPSSEMTEAEQPDPTASAGNGRRGSAEATFLDLSREELHELLRLMVTARRFEEKCAEGYQLGKIGGFLHLYIGQEAVAAGAIPVMRDDDFVITAYRDHAQAIMRGASCDAVMAELFGRVDGVSKGHGGSMHLFDKAHNFMGGHGIVGSHLPLATGVGYAIRYRGGDQVCLCFFGDSVVNIGAFHESLNMAARWKIPVIFLLENNAYGMGTDISRVAAAKELIDRGRAYEGLHTAVVDGMDVMAVRAAVSKAAELARADGTPSYLEVRTYRYMGHSMADPSSGTYRTKEELAKWRADDPILDFRARLIEAGELTEETYEEMDKAAIATVEAAAAFAEASPVPEPDAIYEDVYSDDYHDDVRRRDAWR